MKAGVNKQRIVVNKQRNQVNHRNHVINTSAIFWPSRHYSLGLHLRNSFHE